MVNMTVNLTMTRSGNGIGIAMPASGAYAMLPCSFAGTAITARKRHIDVAFEHNPGTPVWSPPT